MKKYRGYALITGASRGMGYHFADLLAAQGYDLVLVARNLVDLRVNSRRFQEKYGVDVQVFQQDLSSVDAADRVEAFLKEKEIQVGILINNAGFGSFGHFTETNQQEQTDIMNLIAGFAMKMTYKVLPGMVERDNGAVVFVSSVLAHFESIPLGAVYGASKTFVHHFSHALHLENQKNQVDFMCLCPGATNTDIWNPVRMRTDIKIAMMSPRDVVEHALSRLGKEFHVHIDYFAEKCKRGLLKVMPRNTRDALLKQEIADVVGVKL